MFYVLHKRKLDVIKKIDFRVEIQNWNLTCFAKSGKEEHFHTTRVYSWKKDLRAINFQSDFKLDVFSLYVWNIFSKDFPPFFFFFFWFSSLFLKSNKGFHLYHYTWSNTFSREKRQKLGRWNYHIFVYFAFLFPSPFRYSSINRNVIKGHYRFRPAIKETLSISSRYFQAWWFWYFLESQNRFYAWWKLRSCLKGIMKHTNSL